MSAHQASRPLTQTDRDTLSYIHRWGPRAYAEILDLCYLQDRTGQQHGHRDIDRLIRDGCLRQDLYGVLRITDRGIKLLTKGYAA